MFPNQLFVTLVALSVIGRPLARNRPSWPFGVKGSCVCSPISRDGLALSLYRQRLVGAKMFRSLRIETKKVCIVRESWPAGDLKNSCTSLGAL